MDVFISMIMPWAANFAPQNWAFCNGQLMSIAQNQALFSLIGTYYGGDGRSTFALPDLRGRTIVGAGQGPGLPNFILAQNLGVETIQIPQAQVMPGAATAVPVHVPQGAGVYNNMQPSLVLNYIIALYGYYPSRW